MPASYIVSSIKLPDLLHACHCERGTACADVSGSEAISFSIRRLLRPAVLAMTGIIGFFYKY